MGVSGKTKQEPRGRCQRNLALSVSALWSHVMLSLWVVHCRTAYHVPFGLSPHFGPMNAYASCSSEGWEVRKWETVAGGKVAAFIEYHREEGSEGLAHDLWGCG